MQPTTALTKSPTPQPVAPLAAAAGTTQVGACHDANAVGMQPCGCRIV